MRFDDRFLEEIKTRVRLSDVIGKTVKLFFELGSTLSLQ